MLRVQHHGECVQDVVTNDSGLLILYPRREPCEIISELTVRDSSKIFKRVEVIPHTRLIVLLC